MAKSVLNKNFAKSKKKNRCQKPKKNRGQKPKKELWPMGPHGGAHMGPQFFFRLASRVLLSAFGLGFLVWHSASGSFLGRRFSRFLGTSFFILMRPVSKARNTLTSSFLRRAAPGPWGGIFFSPRGNFGPRRLQRMRSGIKF